MQHSLMYYVFARELSLLGDANEQVSFFSKAGFGRENFNSLLSTPTPKVPISLCIAIPSIVNLCLFAFEQDQSVDNITGSFITVHRLEKLNIFLFVVGEAN